MGKSDLLIIMYHYVHNTSNFRFNVKALDSKEFEYQLNVISKHRTIITPDDFFCFVNERKTLPSNPCLLTFDDGYEGNYSVVFPILKKYNLSALFFPVTTAVIHKELLLVNAIQIILSMTDNTQLLLSQIKSYATSAGITNKDFNNIVSQIDFVSRYDDKETTIIKRLFHYAFEDTVAREISEKLFSQYLNLSTRDIADKFYLSRQQISEMSAEGMHFGMHSNRHVRLDRLSLDQQKLELVASKSFLQSIGQPDHQLSIAFPFGRYNEHTLSLLEQLNVKVGFTARDGFAEIQKRRFLELPRIDAVEIDKMMTG